MGPSVLIILRLFLIIINKNRHDRLCAGQIPLREQGFLLHSPWRMLGRKNGLISQGLRRSTHRYRLLPGFRHGRTRFLVDCDMFQGPKTLKALNWEEFPFNPREIGAVLGAR